MAEIRNKKSIIDSLQKQIKPHYIYNTIETFKMMAEINGHTELSDGLTSFGSQIRYTMVYGLRPTTLGMELENLRDYIRIQNLLKNNLIELYDNVVGDVLNNHVPVLILQPIAENAIQYGFDNKNKLYIHIDCEVTDDYCILCVKNNGIQIEKERLDEINNELQSELADLNNAKDEQDSIALVNIHNRIRLTYGMKYGVKIDNTADGNGVIVKIYLPQSTKLSNDDTSEK